ncbi:hypothetical protein [Embleya scabrispora]|uniref:hypothetical protein n=1 Tax=Embleya scabrispora TaxID=159449 RepID=UPI0003AA5F44|nr:hypothetical protein [Embleya scabrispora]MYS80017.1 hypothetical protein [Streptomyces sp. SID5474]
MDPLLAAALTALDVADEPHPLTAHHTHAWRAGRWKIKTTTEPATATLLLHEVHAVRLLHSQGLHAPDGRHGRVGDGVWTAVEFLPGTDLWHWCARGRVPDPPPDFAARLLTVARRAFTALERLNVAGWRHGDLQPWNVLVGPTDEVAFVDHEYTHHPALLPLPHPYRGGMDHATTPDVARRLLSTTPDTHIRLTPADERHALAATLRWAWTGTTPQTTRDVGPDVTLTDLLEDIATGRHRVPLSRQRPWPAPEFEALLQHATHRNPAHRT